MHGLWKRVSLQGRRISRSGMFSSLSPGHGRLNPLLLPNATSSYWFYVCSKLSDYPNVLKRSKTSDSSTLVEARGTRVTSILKVLWVHPASQ